MAGIINVTYTEPYWDEETGTIKRRVNSAVLCFDSCRVSSPREPDEALAAFLYDDPVKAGEVMHYRATRPVLCEVVHPPHLDPNIRSAFI